MEKRYRIHVKGVVKYEEKYLIVKKWMDDRIVNPYQWGFCDAEVPFGVAPDKAVLDAVVEQTGLSTIIGKILYTWFYMLGDECNIGIAYICLTENDNVVLSEDLSECEWISEDEFGDYIDNEKVLEDIAKAGLQ